MKKLLIGLLLIASIAGAYYKDLVVGETAGHQVVISRGGVLSEGSVTFAANDVTPSVATGNICVTGVNTGATAITDLDNPVAGATYTLICGSVAGGFQSTIADAGNFILEGAWTPATVGDSITLYCFADNDYREVARGYAVTGQRLADPLLLGPGAIATPSLALIADANMGFRGVANQWLFSNAGADIFDITTANGISSIGFNGPIGTVAPAPVTGTNGVFSGSFEYGQAPDELHNNYRRTETIIDSDDFRGGVDATYAVKYNVAGVVGAGTNTVTVRDGWSELVTGGAGGPDMESTVTVGLDYLRAFAPRAESVVDLASVAGQRFEWGFYAAGNDFVEIVFDTAIGPNWVLQIDDTAGVETIDSGIVATVNPTKLELVVTAAGVVTWAIDGVPCTVVGLTNNMTAAAHSFRWMETDIAAAAHTVAVDYIEIERNKY